MDKTPHTSPFDAIRKVDEDGNEYWKARDLARLLGYKDWRNFMKAISKAREACEQSGRAASLDFVGFNEIVKAGATSKPREDYRLSRYLLPLLKSCTSSNGALCPSAHANWKAFSPRCSRATATAWR